MKLEAGQAMELQAAHWPTLFVSLLFLFSCICIIILYVEGRREILSIFVYKRCFVAKFEQVGTVITTREQ